VLPAVVDGGRAPAYAWLNDVICVGIGRLSEGGVTYDVHQVC
jgi:hypothetical protein